MSKLLYSISSAGHRQRLRERFDSAASAGMHTYEVLELLLTYSIHRRDVKPVAKRLIERFGGLAAVFDASRDELLSVDEVGPASATLIRLVKEIGVLCAHERMKDRDLITSPDRVVAYALAKLAGLPHEAFMILFLNIQNELIDTAVINEGTVDQVAVYPRRIIEAALARHAAGLILVHNHPSGHVQPSDEDRRLTDVIKDSARLFDIRVLDHLVVGTSGYFSFVEHGYL